MVYLSLLHNLGLLLSLTVVQSLLVRRFPKQSLYFQGLSGLIFGAIGIAGMLTPVHLLPGVIFDGRSIILAVGGFFGGPVTALISALLCGAYRYWLGGNGTLMGLCVITESAGFGVLFHYLRRRFPQIVRPWGLLALGLLVHATMLGLMATLPGVLSWEALRQVGLPVILVYPLTTFLACLFFLEAEARVAGEAALRQSLARARALLNNPGSVALLLDRAGTILDANQKASEVFAQPIDKLRGASIWSLLASDRAARRQDDLQRVLERRLPVSFETAHRHQWYEVSLTPILNDAGEALGVSLMAWDITQRKLAEQHLRHAQKMEAVGQLAGGVAHDFNNILAATMMQLGMLRENPHLDQRTHQALRELEAGTKRAAGLTRQLLMFSRRSVLEVKVLDLNGLVTNLLKMLRRLIGEPIDLRFKGQPGLPAVEADAGMLEQVLMNLAVNARDAMPKGGRLTISTHTADISEEAARSHPDMRPGRFICLSVCDTGCGMDEATLKRVFEPFFTTKSVGKGTGLGLATVYGIVAQHQGWIQVRSAPAQGTTFDVFLPATNKPLQPAPPSEPQIHALHGHETILLVEDERSLRQTVCRTLQAYGYRVYEAPGSQEALTLWQQFGHQIDLLFTDMVLPDGMSGLDLARHLRQKHPALKVIISSGYSQEISDQALRAEAGILYLPKPYESSELANLLRQCLEQS